jgi:hypothetical protein
MLMHLLRLVRMLRTTRGANRQDATGIQAAQAEQAQVKEEAQRLSKLVDESHRIGDRARAIRAENGFAELMDQLAQRRRPHPHGNGGTA